MPPERRRRRRIFQGVVGALVLLVCAVVLVCWWTLPPAHARLRIPALSAPVDITLDDYGIPRIKAASEADAATALGYLHARDRMFEMDLMRRAASGRLSELAGARALPLDRMSRTLGEEQHAERAYATLPEDAKALLVAYSAGVNAWIAQRGRFSAPEFVALGTPGAWRPVECLLWNETVALWLSENFRLELSRMSLAGKVSAEKIKQMWPAQDGLPAPDASTLPLKQGFWEHLPAFPEPFTLPSEASNAWAVDARHTTTGAPLLAGDPHLALQFPSLWYLARIETPGHTLVGATAPGVPFLIIGRNAHIAWSFTTTGADTQDLFIETLLPDGQYQTPDGPRRFTTRQERIQVRGGADTLLTVRSTRHGPVISDLLAAKNGPILALEAAQYERDSAVGGILALDRASTVEEAGRAAVLIHAPVQNLTVADQHGIALFTTGDIPIRRSGNGAAAVEGADGQHDWTGYTSGDALPHYVNPASGVVVNANDRTAPPDFPVFMGADWFAPWRARRIHQLLDAKPTQSIADFAAMQRDDVSVFARDLLPILEGLPRQTGAVGQAQALLARWDGTMAIGLPQPLIFNTAVQLFVSHILAANHVPERDAGPWASFADWLLTSPQGAGWCNGDCKAAFIHALQDAVGDLVKTHGADPAAWRWGDVHEAIFAHPLLGSLPVIGHLAARRVPVPGDDTTLFRGGNGVLGQFASLHGAGFRGIYDLADLDRSRFVVTPGQSGNFFSPHAWDLLKLWAAGATITIPPSPSSVRATISLNP